MGDFYGKFMAGAGIFKALIGLALLFLMVGLMGAAWTDLPSGNFLLDILLWWLGLFGLVFGGALLAARLRMRLVGPVDTGEYFPFSKLLVDVGSAITGLLVAGYFLPELFAEKPDHTGDAIVFGIGALIFLFSAGSLYTHTTRP